MVAKTQKNFPDPPSQVEWNPNPSVRALERSEISKIEYGMLYSVGVLDYMTVTENEKILTFCRLMQRGLVSVRNAKWDFNWRTGPFIVGILSAGRALLTRIAADCRPPNWERIRSALQHLSVTQGRVVGLQMLRQQLPSSSYDYLKPIFEEHPLIEVSMQDRFTRTSNLILREGWEEHEPKIPKR